jgi:hypothetical protein
MDQGDFTKGKWRLSITGLIQPKLLPLRGEGWDEGFHFPCLKIGSVSIKRVKMDQRDFTNGKWRLSINGLIQPKLLPLPGEGWDEGFRSFYWAQKELNR